VWSRRTDGGHGDDAAYAIAVSPDGSKVYVTGESPGVRSADDYLTVAYNAHTGANVWARRYNGTGNRNDIANAIAVSPDGSKVFVTGRSRNASGNSDYLTYAYSSKGVGVWLRRYDGTAHRNDMANAIAVSPDGRKVFVTGQSGGNGGGIVTYDYVTYAYGAKTGGALWGRRYNHDTDIATSIGVSPRGGAVIVTGSTSEGYTTLAYRA
jgi:DNA-binding beta-propeller fold protein YncE